MVDDVTAATMAGTPVAVPLVAHDVNGDPLTLRIVSQAGHGTVGLAGTLATYYPETGFTGVDTFTFAAWDGSIDSNLGTATLTVGGGGECASGPDLDGDGVPDTCDPADAELTVTVVKLRTTKVGLKATLNGTFATLLPGDTFDTAAGVTLEIDDGGDVSIGHPWSATDCAPRGKGAIRCRSADRSATLDLQPDRAVAGAWRLRAKLAGPGAGNLTSPATVRLTHGAGIDRVGQATACTQSARALICRT